MTIRFNIDKSDIDLSYKKFLKEQILIIVITLLYMYSCEQKLQIVTTVL